MRITLYVLLPLAIVVGLVLGSQGVIQTFDDPVAYRTLEARTLNVTDEESAAVTQSVYRGPAASQVAIKQIGTNGGGYFNANSAVPFENPTGLANFVEMLMILLIPAALTYTFGIMAGSHAQGWSLFAAMMVVIIVAIFVAVPFEQRGEVLQQTGVKLSSHGRLDRGQPQRQGAAPRDHQLGAVGRHDRGVERVGEQRARRLDGRGGHRPADPDGHGGGDIRRRRDPASTGCCCSSSSRCSWRG